MVFRVEPVQPILRAGLQMQLPSTNKKLSPNRFHGLILGTAFIVAAVIGTNAIVLKELRQDALEDVQGDLLRQSLTLSELAERTIRRRQNPRRLAREWRSEKACRQTVPSFLKRKDVRIAANRYARCP
jgi:hypothetical protein